MPANCSSRRLIDARLIAGVILGLGAAPSAWAEPPSKAELPAVRITQPADGAMVQGLVTITVDSADTRRVDHISVYKDGAILGSDFSVPYTVAWDTRLDRPGPHTLSVRAIGVDFVEAASPEIHVTADNGSPHVELAVLHDGAVVVGSARLHAEASDEYGVARVKFLVDGQEVGSVEQPPFDFTWQTTALPNRTYTVQARAIDRAGNSATSEPLTAKLANPNHPPKLEAVSPKTVKEGEPLTFPLKAKDPDGARDPLTYRASNLPAWASVNPQTGVVSGTPGSSEASLSAPTKLYDNIGFTVCDPEPLCASQSTSFIVIDTNRPPVLEPTGDHAIKEGELFTMTLVAHDPDGDVLTCGSGHLPRWLHFDDALCVAHGVPDAEVATTSEPTTTHSGIMFQVCDAAGACAKQYSTLTVSDISNRRPVLSGLEPRTIDEEQLLVVDIEATDPDDPGGGSLVIAVTSGMPQGAAFEDHGLGSAQLRWTPVANQSGKYEVRASVTDGEFTEHGVLPITVRETIVTVSGIILDNQEAPAPGVEIQTVTSQETFPSMYTNNEGFYLIKIPKPGTYKIKPKYALKKDFIAQARSGKVPSFEPREYFVRVGHEDLRNLDFKMSFTN